MRGCRWVVIALPLCVGAAYGGSLDGRYAAMNPYLGLHVGSFASALTPAPDDDLNFNPCDDRVRDCSVHADPLINILLELDVAADSRPAVAFYRNESGRALDDRLDLLGRGCGTKIGALESFETAGRTEGETNALRWTARFDLQVTNRACTGRLRPTSRHFLLLHGLEEPSTGERRLQVAIDRSVVDRNYLYVEEDGVRRRVRMDLDNTRDSGRRAQYRVCIEDDEGEFSRCVVTDRSLKNFALPLPVPGGVALNYTWWYKLYPDLKRTRGLYELEQYLADFEPLDGSDQAGQR